MPISFSLHSALLVDETRQRILHAQEKYGDILSYFWISKVGNAEQYNIEDDAEFGFHPRSCFIVQWNKDRPELIQLIPRIFYELFGKENILIRNDDYDVVPPV